MKSKLALAAFALVTAATTAPALAAPTFFDFDLKFTEGPLASQTFTGTLSVEGDDCTGPGGRCDGTFGPEGPLDLLSLDITVDGVAFSMADDKDFPLFPSVTFDAGIIESFDFAAESGLYFLDVIGRGVSFGLIADPNGDGSSFGRVVPEPGTLPLLAVAAVIGVAALRRRKASVASPAAA